MSPVPRIGKDKSDVLKIADDLAAKSRILRRTVEAEAADTAEDIDEAVDRLASLAAEQHEIEQSAREARAVEVYARYQSQYQPVIEKAERILAENTSAVAELSPFIRRLGSLDWKAIRARSRNSFVAGSLHSTQTKLGLLQRSVEEAVEILRGDDRDLVHWLTEVKRYTGHEEESLINGVTSPAEREARQAEHQASRQYAVNGLRAVLNPRGETLRIKAGAIRKLLAEVAKDLAPVDAAVVEEGR